MTWHAKPADVLQGAHHPIAPNDTRSSRLSLPITPNFLSPHLARPWSLSTIHFPLMNTLTWVKSKFAEATEALREAHPDLAQASADCLKVLQCIRIPLQAHSPVNLLRTVSPFRLNGPCLLVSQQGRWRMCQGSSPRQSTSTRP